MTMSPIAPVTRWLNRATRVPAALKAAVSGKHEAFFQEPIAGGVPQFVIAAQKSWSMKIRGRHERFSLCPLPPRTDRRKFRTQSARIA